MNAKSSWYPRTPPLSFHECLLLILKLVSSDLVSSVIREPGKPALDPGGRLVKRRRGYSSALWIFFRSSKTISATKLRTSPELNSDAPESPLCHHFTQVTRLANTIAGAGCFSTSKAVIVLISWFLTIPWQRTPSKALDTLLQRCFRMIRPRYNCRLFQVTNTRLTNIRNSLRVQMPAAGSNQFSKEEKCRNWMK